MAQKSNAALEKQVRNAMKTLADAGKAFTNENVRQTIGGGSFRDIGPRHARVVRAQTAATENPDCRPDQPTKPSRRK